MKKVLPLIAFLLASLPIFAHVYEIRVNQAQDGSLTWYLITYHGVNECGHANAGLTINGVNYPIDAEFAGDGALLSPNVFATIGFPFTHASYATVHTPFLGTNISVAPYSNNVCWAFAVGGSGNFTPPPPPVCTSCPITGWNSVFASSGNNNGTPCDLSDDVTTATIKVNHLSCASITGTGKFSVIYDFGGTNISYGPYNYTAGGIETDVTINVPSGASNTTQVQVIDYSYPCNVTHGLTIPGGQYSGEKENIPPVISCPANISVGTDPGTCTAIVNYALPAYSDNCGIATIQQIGGLPSGANFPQGNTTNTFKVTDPSGNSATCSFVVSVTDLEPPTARCQTAFPVIDANGNASITVADINNGSYDNCGSVTVSITSGQTSFSCVDAGKTFPVTILVTDAAGNTSTCTGQVVVTDPNSVCNKPPVAVCKALTVSANANCQGTATALDFDGGSSDPDAGDVITFSVSPAGPYNIGVTNVTLTVTDSKGATSSCNTTITVVDDEAPKAKCKPLSVTLVNGAATITAASVNDGSTDNCGIASIEVSKTAFDCSNIGANSVTLTVTDVHGNVASCVATVTVVGEIPSCSIASIPTSNVYTGGNNNNLYLGYGAQSTTLKVTPAANGAPYTYSWTGAATGMLSSTTSGSPVFTPTAAGNYSFTVTTTNVYGCTTTCSISICVSDIRVVDSKGKLTDKVYVCHLPPGNPGNPQILSVSVNAVPAHLSNHAGDRLGSCNMPACGVATASTSSTPIVSALSAPKEVNLTTSEEDLKVTVSPNPSNGYFTLKLESKFNTPVNMKVMDASGRVVDARSKIVSNSTIQIGHNYRSGTYYAEMIQGGNRKVIQLIKTTN